MNYSQIIDLAIEGAEKRESNLHEDFRTESRFGYSGILGRHMLNNLVRLTNPRYLEVGVMMGHNFVPTLYGNSFEHAFAVDLWPGREAEIHKKPFLQRLNKYFPNQDNISVIHEDCFALNPSDYGIEDINLYFYDADHSAEAQFQAWNQYLPYMAKEFIMVVDDFRCARECNLCRKVRLGTYKAVSTLPIEIKHSKTITSPRAGRSDGWWHGFYVAHVQKLGE